MGRRKLEEDESREVNKPRSYKVRKHMVRRVALIPNTVSGKSLKVFKQGNDIFFFNFIFKLYITVLVLPNIKMNPPQVYMCYIFSLLWLPPEWM